MAWSEHSQGPGAPSHLCGPRAAGEGCPGHSVVAGRRSGWDVMPDLRHEPFTCSLQPAALAPQGLR